MTEILIRNADVVVTMDAARSEPQGADVFRRDRGRLGPDEKVLPAAAHRAGRLSRPAPIAPEPPHGRRPAVPSPRPAAAPAALL